MAIRAKVTSGNRTTETEFYFLRKFPCIFRFFSLFFCVSDSSCERLHQMPIDKKSNFSSNFTAFITLECMCKYHSSGGLNLPKMVTFIGRILYSFEFRTNSHEYVRLSSIRRILIFLSICRLHFFVLLSSCRDDSDRSSHINKFFSFSISRFALIHSAKADCFSLRQIHFRIT